MSSKKYNHQEPMNDVNDWHRSDFQSETLVAAATDNPTELIGIASEPLDLFPLATVTNYPQNQAISEESYPGDIHIGNGTYPVSPMPMLPAYFLARGNMDPGPFPVATVANHLPNQAMPEELQLSDIRNSIAPFPDLAMPPDYFLAGGTMDPQEFVEPSLPLPIPFDNNLEVLGAFLLPTGGGE